VNLYAESSAVLAWLLLEREGSRVDRLLTAAESVISSDLTLIECDRALLRAGCHRSS
jgi:PIN domain nuclease of toxin-antitoxin system